MEDRHQAVLLSYWEVYWAFAELLACVLQLQDVNNYSATTLTVTVHSTRL
jgi:hypothetical protein